MVNASWQWTFESVIPPSILGLTEGGPSGLTQLLSNAAVFLSVLNLKFRREH